MLSVVSAVLGVLLGLLLLGLLILLRMPRAQKKGMTPSRPLVSMVGSSGHSNLVWGP